MKKLEGKQLKNVLTCVSPTRVVLRETIVDEFGFLGRMDGVGLSYGGRPQCTESSDKMKV